MTTLRPSMNLETAINNAASQAYPENATLLDCETLAAILSVLGHMTARVQGQYELIIEHTRTRCIIVLHTDIVFDLALGARIMGILPQGGEKWDVMLRAGEDNALNITRRRD